MKFSLWPDNDRPPAELLDEVRDGRGRRLARRLAGRPLHAQHRRRDARAGRRLRVLGPAARPGGGHRTGPDRHARLAHLGPPPGAAGQARGHHRPALRRPDGPRPRGGLADQRAPRLRHRARAAGQAGEPVRGGDPRSSGRCCAQDSTTFHGAFYDITDAPCDPKPVQSPLPILVGTRSPRMLRITARHADEWNTWGTPEQAAVHRAALLRGLRQGRPRPGHDADLGQRLHRPGREPRCRAAGRRSPARPAAVVDQLGQYAELGFDEFILPDWNLGPDQLSRHPGQDQDRGSGPAHGLRGPARSRPERR